MTKNKKLKKIFILILIKSRLIVLYIKRLKEKRSLYSVMIAKKFDSLKQAMEFALRIDSRILV
ncbi:hypothetical protein U3516DRAFT_747845 [Neocallimastix sp. 'constans']